MHCFIRGVSVPVKMLTEVGGGASSIAAAADVTMSIRKTRRFFRMMWIIHSKDARREAIDSSQRDRVGGDIYPRYIIQGCIITQPRD